MTKTPSTILGLYKKKLLLIKNTISWELVAVWLAYKTQSMLIKDKKIRSVDAV